MMTRKNKKIFFITVRLTFRGIRLPLRDSILVLFQLLINVQFFCKKEKIKSLNRQFREIKFHANTIFLRDREIKDSRNATRKFSRNLCPAEIKENKVSFTADCHMPNRKEDKWPRDFNSLGKCLL